jgi:nitroreductase
VVEQKGFQSLAEVLDQMKTIDHLHRVGGSLADAIRIQGAAIATVVACLRGVRPVWPLDALTSYDGSIHLSVQNLLLAARAAGLGAALITLPLWSPWLARRALGLPWRVTPCAVVPLGWPLGRYGPTTRRPVGAVVHLDRYCHQPFKTPRP